MKKPAMSTREHAISLIDLELRQMRMARAILAGNVFSSNHDGRKRTRRHMSAEARHRISLSQKRRWALRRKAA